ncbi:MAG: T9SS type A sorting domain-containing protein [Phaeodactylibacter sp.]|nr:T9SS type A sorting domain-containing protein [Phaeodactylibacter sp.]
MKNTYQSTPTWLSRCCVSFRKLMAFTLAVFSSSLLMAQPANDNCSGAQPITVGTAGNCTVVNTTNVGATDDGPQSCDGTTNNLGTWYSFTAPTGADLLLQVIDLGAGNPEAAIYDACGGTEVFCSGSPDAVVVNGLTPGATYYLLVWGDGSAGTGAFDLCLEEFVPPMNDFCSSAMPVTVGADGTCPGASTTVSNIGATDDGPQSCDGTTNNIGVWFSFVAPASGGVNVQIEDLGPGDQEASIYDGCGGTEIWCDGTPNNEVVSGLTGGNTYYLLVWSDGTGLTAPFGLCLQEFVPLTNDDCATATPVAVNSTVSGNTGTATDSNPPSCGGAGDGSGGGVWYSVTGTGLDITASLCGSGFDTQIAVYEGSCTSLSCVVGNDDFCGTQSQVTWNSLAGTTYYLYIDGFSTASGGFILDVSGMLPPPIDNDDCATANTITCGETLQGSTIGAFPDAVRRCGPGTGSGGVWYTFNPDGGGFYQSLSTCDAANFDTKITVYYGDCNRLRCLGSVDNSEACGGGTSEMVFVPFFGRTHYVLVQTTDPMVPGIFDLTYDCNYSFRGTPPANVFTADVSQGYERIRLYPNPVQDELNVQLQAFSGGQATLSVRNGLGQVLMQRRIGQAESQVERLNTSQLQAGMYFLTVQVEGGGTFTEKFMVGSARP